MLCTRILSCLLVMLVIFQASSSPVDKANLVQTSPNPSESYDDEALPVVYTPTGSKDYSQMILNAKGTFSNFTCGACRFAVGLLRDMLDSDMSFNEIAEVLGEICTQSGKYTQNVCEGTTQTFKDEVLTVFSMVALSANEICGSFLKDCGSTYNPFNQQWNISIPGNKPSVEPVMAPKEGSPVIRILQLTDIHYDPLYTEGLTSVCGEPLCCRTPNAQGDAATAAGPWGDYNCDVPNRTLLHLFKNLQNTQDQFDWIYWTGDLVAHHIWNQTRTETLNELNYLYSLFERYLPDKPLFPTFGNHDTVPVNGFPPPFIVGNQSMEWLVEPTIAKWSHWLAKYPDWSATEATLKRGGFYNVKVGAGLRVIGLQTTYCSKQDFWLLVNATDPGGQLQWLSDQLQEAESSGVKVHIIGHHPPGISEAMPSYAYSYRDIVNRFESTIVGQFFGHTHTDSFKLFMDENLRPTNVAFISPGVTSYQGLNLGYRIYTIDGSYNNSSHAVLDHETYVFDLDKANNGTPLWALEYSVKSAFNMSSLQPDSFYDLWKRMTSSQYTLQLFNTFYSKSRLGASNSSTAILCDIVTTTPDNNPLCSSSSSSSSPQFLKNVLRGFGAGAAGVKQGLEL